MRYFLAALSVFGVMHATQVAAQDDPVVVELYTSQGCSSCPPADEMLHDLAKRDDVIALALHVDYWDYIGWKDIFANPAFTARQHAYARAANATSVYTPQMIINGVEQVVGSRPMQVMDALQAQREAGSLFDLQLTRREGAVLITAEPGQGGDYAVQLVRYIPEETVDIRRGENAGRKLSYANIVTSWEVVAEWDGRSPLAFEADAAGDSPIVVILQQSTHGPIVGAAVLR
ncbi:hypothetical protein C7964_105140 [Loktanella sp. PT4BL]|jgi:hypothetical protein|uniref:DUF1223 domain-containing protein n=1 Tax=Loktanella sp. PT4BL TaxID=2135611 RepID=UPI000D76CF85|nr:DUF1223 domain-containing protein [Loktanella sp. PT4BL]PXW67791.1 hypothetical protein C7964_105140 [Loktanella sp. PT4BL]